MIVIPADCDSCVVTLLNDLVTMSEELRLVKSQLQGLSASSGALEQIRHLETQAKDLRVSCPWGWGKSRCSANTAVLWYLQGSVPRTLVNTKAYKS